MVRRKLFRRHGHGLFNAAFQHLLWGTYENHRKLPSLQPVNQPGFKPDTSQTKVHSIIITPIKLVSFSITNKDERQHI
jgi:hypothetical protein